MSTHERPLRGFAVAIAALIALGEMSGSGPLLLGGGEAHAVIGRPLTPMSYAGVARRTTRRAVYAGAYYRPPVYAAPYAAAPVVTALPAGCARVLVGGVVQYSCGTAAYRPYYDGPTVVYQPVP